MQPISLCLRLNRSISMVVLLIGLLSLPASQVSAAPPHQGDKAPASFYQVSLDSLRSKQICIGQQIMIHGEFGPGVPLALLVPSTNASTVPLAPLEQMDIISLTTDLGVVSPEKIPPGTDSGTFSGFFTANKAGTATITATLWVKAGQTQKSDATAHVSIKVTDTCQYLYKLYGEGNYVYTTNNIFENFKIFLQSKGLLTAPDSNNPLKMEKRNALIRQDITYIDFLPGQCSSWDANAGGGFGFLDATTDPTLDGFGIDLKLGPPQDFSIAVETRAVCDGKPIAVGQQPGTLSSSNDPWIEQEFPADGGTFKIKIDFFEKSIKYALISGASQASYTASLTLQRVEQP